MLVRIHSDRIIKILESVKCVAHAVGNTYVLFMYLASLLFASYTVFDNVIVTDHVLFANFVSAPWPKGLKLYQKCSPTVSCFKRQIPITFSSQLCPNLKLPVYSPI